ncbi:MAG: LptA/OstA family protein [Puniceicoccales bacterium]
MRLLSVLIAFLSLSSSAFSESAPANPASTADVSRTPLAESPLGKTVITSDRLDVINTEKGNQFIFSGTVVIQGEDFIAECDRMEVRTDSEKENDFGAIAMIEATGGVTIRQGDRVATAGRALIHPQSDEVILEDQPSVRDGRGTVSGYRMILHGEDRKISVEPGPDGQQPRVELPSLESIRKKDNDE